MFSLIITIIAIALVAALAVATIYYGGDILVSQKAKANAATLDAQTQQIFAASQAYYLDNNAWPANVAVLAVDGKYLKTSPVPPGSAYAALPLGLVGAAYADGDGAVTGTLPDLVKPLETYLGGTSDLVTDFRVSADDAAVLRTQLLQLNGRTDANGANLAAKTLQLMQREIAVQTTGKPSLLDYTWPAAAAQNPRTRYLWIPAKVNKETCRAVNVQWRQTILIPDSYSATNGTVQCFGDDTAGYSYFWLSPGADPNQIVLPGQPSGGTDVCSNIAGAQATVPSGMVQAGTTCVASGASSTCGVSQTQMGNACVASVPRPATGMMTPDVVDLGELPLNTTVTKSLTIRNDGAMAATPTVLVTENTQGDAPYYGSTAGSGTLGTLTVANPCGLLEPGGECVVSVSYKPTTISRTFLTADLSWDTLGDTDASTGEGRGLSMTGAAPPVVPSSGTMAIEEDCRGKAYTGVVCLPAGSSFEDFVKSKLVFAYWAPSLKPIHFKAIGGADLSAGVKLAITGGGFLDWWSSAEEFHAVCTTDSCYVMEQVVNASGNPKLGLEDYMGYQTYYNYIWYDPFPGGIPVTFELRDAGGAVVATHATVVPRISPNPWYGQIRALETGTGAFSYGSPSVGVTWKDNSCQNTQGEGYSFRVYNQGSETTLVGAYAGVASTEVTPGCYLAQAALPASAFAGLESQRNVKLDNMSQYQAEDVGSDTIFPEVLRLDYGYDSVLTTVLPIPVAQSCLSYGQLVNRGGTVRTGITGASNDAAVIVDVPTAVRLRERTSGAEVSVSWTRPTNREISFTVPTGLATGEWQVLIENQYGKTIKDWQQEFPDTLGAPWVLVPTAQQVADSLGSISWYLSQAGCSLPAAYYGTEALPGAPESGWGSWEAVTAFGGLSCTPGESGYCQTSGASTGSICPQWDFTTSGGSYNGCLRRKCDNPLYDAAFIPGC